MPKPPPPKPHKPPPHKHHAPSSHVLSFIDKGRIDRLLAPWIPDAADRAFVVRCVLSEGPAHHRGANFVLLSLLGELLGPIDEAPDGATAEVPMRIPPHLASDNDDGVFPLRLPIGELERLAPAGSPAQAAMIDCLTDGPPQHSLANAAMMCLLSALLARARSGPR